MNFVRRGFQTLSSERRRQTETTKIIYHTALQVVNNVGVLIMYRLTSTILMIFTALRGMQTRSSNENSVCPSVDRPSVTRVDCDKTVERSVQIYIPYERTFSQVF